MARGEKFCGGCNHRCGPRSWQCPACGKGFIVKGFQHPNITPQERAAEVQDARQGLDRTERKQLMALVQTCRDTHEISVRRKYYGKKSRTWESLDGSYRIRFGPVFLGVSIKLDDNKPYRLLYQRNGEWRPVVGKNRFKKLWVAIRQMARFQNGKDNPQKDSSRPPIRVSKVRRGKLVVSG